MAGCRPAPLTSVDVGDIAVTYLPDGEGHFVGPALFPASDPEVWGAGPGDFDIPGVGCGTNGRLLDSLREAGVAPEDVDTVVFTHLHADHVGWAATGSDHALTFSNARHVMGAAREWEFRRANPDAPFAPPAEAALDPLEDRVEPAEDGEVVAPGVTLIATPGHTPGHQTVVVSSGAELAVLLGDVMHCPLQVSAPEWGVLFDVDPEQARRTRERMLAELEGQDVAVGCCHFSEAAFGRIMRASGKRTWRPFA